ncbi:hypothetical protein ONZ45_g9393 [Pleurotus djamor]|nr:hypothetical protein ONZ45_g9393 [Pleurotus djamor]
MHSFRVFLDSQTTNSHLLTFPLQPDVGNQWLSPLTFPSTLSNNSANVPNGDSHPLLQSSNLAYPAFATDPLQGSLLFSPSALDVSSLPYDHYQNIKSHHADALDVQPQTQGYGLGHTERVGVRGVLDLPSTPDNALNVFTREAPPRQVVSTAAVYQAAERRRSSPHKFFCTLCARGFTAKHNLDRHVAAHYDDRPFICHCRSAFLTIADLRRHQRRTKNHPSEPQFSEIV